MLAWIILSVITVLLTIACFVIAKHVGWSDETGWIFLGFLLGMTAVILICITIFTPFSVKIQIGKFENQKAYIESHISKSALEDATITNTKIEMNDWLFTAQQHQKNYGDFSFYPDEIQDLEPIN